MRVRVTSADPLPPLKLWYELDERMLSKRVSAVVDDIASAYFAPYSSNPFVLLIDDFLLPPNTAARGLIRDGDLLTLKICDAAELHLPGAPPPARHSALGLERRKRARSESPTTTSSTSDEVEEDDARGRRRRPRRDSVTAKKRFKVFLEEPPQRGNSRDTGKGTSGGGKRPTSGTAKKIERGGANKTKSGGPRCRESGTESEDSSTGSTISSTSSSAGSSIVRRLERGGAKKTKGGGPRCRKSGIESDDGSTSSPTSSSASSSIVRKLESGGANKTKSGGPRCRKNGTESEDSSTSSSTSSSVSSSTCSSSRGSSSCSSGGSSSGSRSSSTRSPTSSPTSSSTNSSTSSSTSSSLGSSTSSESESDSDSSSDDDNSPPLEVATKDVHPPIFPPSLAQLEEAATAQQPKKKKKKSNRRRRRRGRRPAVANAQVAGEEAAAAPATNVQGGGTEAGTATAAPAPPEGNTCSPQPSTAVLAVSAPTPPAMLSQRNTNKKKGFLKQMLGMQRTHIRFDDDEEDGGTDGPQVNKGGEQDAIDTAESGLPPARLIVTEVELEDTPKARPKKQRKQRPALPVCESQGENPDAAEAGEKSLNLLGEAEVCCGSADGDFPAEMPDRDYDALPGLTELPDAGDLIAFKIVEMSAGYTPEISAWKEAKVLTVSGLSCALTLRLAPYSREVTRGDWDGVSRRRFEIAERREEGDNEEVIESPMSDEVVTLSFDEMLEAKKIV